MALVKKLDVYDEEFFNNVNLAKKLIEDLAEPSDREICKKWINHLFNLKSTDPNVKKNRNHFFKYALHIMNQAVKNEKNAKKGSPQYREKHGEKKEGDSPGFMSRWSDDKRTYVAIKPLSGEGALVYMAVTSNQSLGWDHKYPLTR